MEPVTRARALLTGLHCTNTSFKAELQCEPSACGLAVVVTEQLSLVEGEERVELSRANMPARLPWICLGSKKDF